MFVRQVDYDKHAVLPANRFRLFFRALSHPRPEAAPESQQRDLGQNSEALLSLHFVSGCTFITPHHFCIAVLNPSGFEEFLL